jgi:hypothetical protein
MTSFQQDPDAQLDYLIRWADWLTDGETIEDYDLTVTDGLTVGANSNTDDTVTVWLSGGTHRSQYQVACRITTSAGRTDERTFTVSVRNR